MSKMSRRNREKIESKNWEEFDDLVRKIARYGIGSGIALEPKRTHPVVNPYPVHSVEWTVRDGIGYYPTLYPNRTEVLHHLFLVNGNGFDWKDGQLVEWGRKETKHWGIPTEEVERRARIRCNLTEPYPFCQYADILHAPDDIKPDWIAAAKEIMAAVPEGYFDNFQLPSVLL